MKRCGRCIRACPAGIDIPSLLIREEIKNAGEEGKYAMKQVSECNGAASPAEDETLSAFSRIVRHKPQSHSM